MNKKYVVLSVILVVVIAIAAAYVLTDKNPNSSKDTGPITITDAEGRTVEVPSDIDSVAVNGKMIIQLVCMFDSNLLDSADASALSSSIARTYQYAFDFSDVDSHEATLTAEDIEELATSDIDVIFVTSWAYDSNSELIDLLAEAKPVVIVDTDDTYLWEDGKLVDNLVDCFTIMGQVLGMENRAQEIIDGINGYLAEITDNIGTTSESIFYGGVRSSLNQTYANSSIIFDMVGIKNAFTSSDYSSDTYQVATLDVETMSKLDIDYFITEPTIYSNIKTATNQNVLSYLYSVNNDDDQSNDIVIYTIMPHASYGALIDCVLASGYALECMIYGESTIEEAQEKFNEIMELFYGDAGEDIYSEMSAAYAEQCASVNCDMPFFSELIVSIDSSGAYVLIEAEN